MIRLWLLDVYRGLCDARETCAEHSDVIEDVVTDKLFDVLEGLWLQLTDEELAVLDGQ
jgi:hypothetical protein